MNEIKCVGINSNNLQPQQFQGLFVMECQKEGQITALRMNNQYAAAIVLGR